MLQACQMAFLSTNLEVEIVLSVPWRRDVLGAYLRSAGRLLRETLRALNGGTKSEKQKVNLHMSSHIFAPIARALHSAGHPPQRPLCAPHQLLRSCTSRP